MTGNVAAAQTPPAPSSQGLSSRAAVRGRVNGLIVHRLSTSSPSARALRAQLRGALGKEVGTVPAIWGLTLDDSPVDLGKTPTYGEKATHAALTLWALHQGSNTQPMHDSSEQPLRFASAIRLIAEKQRGDKLAEETPIYRRFAAAVQAPTFAGLLVHLRSLVSQLNSAEIPCDYGQLAADLFTWQSPRYRTSVMRDWGRQFSRVKQTTNTDTDDN